MKLKNCSKCNKLTVIYKNITIDGEYLRLCKYCTSKYSSVKSKPKQRSNKKVKQDIEYTNKRKNYLLNNSICKAGLPGCTTFSTDIHHIEGRVGNNYLDNNTWIATCRNCHNFIHNNPKLANEFGFLK